MSDGASFLPRIQSVFYSVFDVRQGPKIVYQVPEGLIAVPPPAIPSLSATPSAVPSAPPTPAFDSNFSPPLVPPINGLSSRASSTSLVSPTDFFRSGRNLPSPQKRSSSSHRTLFNFDDISKYVIPPSQLCGRLVTCSTKRHRIIGFPAELKGSYKRNYFRFNLCFVFDRGADLSCYEPIVRKVTRVLTACEEESSFLSNPQTSPTVHAILEQLYEDLNSYSETSIPIDQFNSIELKIFPFYPNPPQVKDWMVPVALINLDKRVEDNWDLTMAKVCKYIDGTNHVRRIAQLADCDIGLTRQAISHLLYYQVIMTIDIFQFSNMYTLRKRIQWLADEAHVKEECGPYVTKPGRTQLDWPRLLHLYSRLKPGKTVYEWMKEYDVEKHGIDPRRFTSFGVIKGFLRRVHRWPIYVPPDLSFQYQNPFVTSQISSTPFDSAYIRQRGNSLSGGSVRFPAYNSPPDLPTSDAYRAILPSTSPEHTQYVNGDAPLPSGVPTVASISQTHRARRASAAEKFLEQLRSKDIQKSGAAATTNPRTSWIHYQHNEPPSTISSTDAAPPASMSVLAAQGESAAAAITPPKNDSPIKMPGSRRHSLISPAVPPPSPVLSKAVLAQTRPRQSHSPSAPHLGNAPIQVAPTHPFPQELVGLLDGEHHTDELAVKFDAGWPLLEQWLTVVGGGEGNGNYGRVSIICR